MKLIRKISGYLPSSVKTVLKYVKSSIFCVIDYCKTRNIVKKLLTQERICIELGPGGQQRDGWIGIDLSGTDINIDLTRKAIPLPDNSVDIIYSSHVFEHFSYPMPMLTILKECYRCLKKGGLFSICVPNATIYVDAYLKGSYPTRTTDFFQPAFHNNSKIDIINYMAYMAGHHKHMFDLEGLIEILKKAGFKNAKERFFDTELDLEVRHWESIYAIASKE